MHSFIGQLAEDLRTLFLRIVDEFIKLIVGIRLIGPSNFQRWFIAAGLGGVVGLVSYYFIELLQALTRFLYRADTDNLLYWVHIVPWWWIVMIPTMGGLITGLILWKFTPDGRVRSISHVIEAAALKNGRVHEKHGLASAFASFFSLSMGASAGQEGPLVHLSAVVASRLSAWFHADGMTARDFLACAAAAAIGASFNAPIAGIIFAHEIILRHYSVSSTTPITIASIMGTITGHLLSGGNFAEVQFFQLSVTSYSELPAFLLLGFVSGIVAAILVRSIFIAEDTCDMVQSHFKIPVWARPMIAGLLLGLLAISFPHIIGVGYQSTVKALHGNLAFTEILILVTIKILATSITLGGRMGGGVFSPSLMVGAMIGLAFGLIATSGTDIGAVQLYALAGMAAVSAAVLGAPLSTSLIVLEMTRDWNAALAVLAAVSVACGLAARLMDKSFFLSQLERRGLHIAAGPQAYLLATFKVTSHLSPLRLIEKSVAEYREMGAFVYAHESFEEALPKYEELDVTTLLVLSLPKEKDQQAEAIGQLEYLDVLRIYSHALADTSAEEHD